MNATVASLADRLDRQQKALLEISRRWRWYEADLDKAVAAIVETATYALDIERASVWFYNAERDAIVCHDLYERTPARHSHGTVLHAADFPAYFNAIHAEEIIPAHDAHRDVRTEAFSIPYLAPLGIGAMLDAPIRLAGRLVGVLCHEHVGGMRHFSNDEQNTATYLANLVSLAYEFQRRAESELATARAASLLRAAFEASGAGVYAVDENGETTTYNQRFLDLWGVPAEFLGPGVTRTERLQQFASRTHDPSALIDRWREIIAAPELHSLDVFEMQDGRSIECVSEPQRLDKRVIGRVWSFRDVTYQRRLEKELQEIAFKDALTGLFNRRRAEETLANEVERARRAAQPFCVAMLDIDNFKKVNDAHGHQVGDDVLRELGRDLKKRLRATDVACRWGGEEFLLILPSTDLAGAMKLVDELRRFVGRERKGIPTFTVSAGVAQYDGRALRADAVIAVADAKLYEAKAQGRNRVCA